MLKELIRNQGKEGMRRENKGRKGMKKSEYCEVGNERRKGGKMFCAISSV